MTQSDQIENPAREPNVSRLAGWVRWKYFPALCLTVWCAIGVLMRAGPSDTVLTSPSSCADFMVPVSGAWALACGLHIHTDFSTPLGLAYYLPYYWALEFFGNTDALVRQVESAIFVVVSVLSFLLLRPPRYSWKITALGVSFISLLASSPVLLGDPPMVIFEGMAFNYLGITVGYLCLLTAIFPPQGDPSGIRRREIRDALLLAAALVWMVFVKVNYLAEHAVFLLGAFVMYRLTQGKWNWRVIGVLAGGFLVMAPAFVLVYHIDLGAMWRDLQMAGASRSRWILEALTVPDGRGGSYRGMTALYFIAQRVLVLHWLELLALFIGLTVVAIAGRTPMWRLAVYGGLMLVVLGCDLLQCLINTYGDALPMLPVLWLFLLCVLERGECLQEDAAAAGTARRMRGGVRWLSAVAIVWHIGLLATGHVTAFVYNTGMSGPLGGGTAWETDRVPESLQAKGWEHLYYVPVPGTDKTNATYATIVNQGLALLRERYLDQKRVFVFDQINPFPPLLRAPYPVGQPAWLHLQATFDPQSHLPAETLLAGADVIMVPKQPLNPNSVTVLISLYPHFLETNYVVTADNACWVILQRKTDL